MGWQLQYPSYHLPEILVGWQARAAPLLFPLSLLTTELDQCPPNPSLLNIADYPQFLIYIFDRQKDSLLVQRACLYVLQN